MALVAVPRELFHSLAQQTPSRIVLLICDGLGGLPNPTTGRTELETARTPILDALAKRSDLGYAELVGLGVTPGSGPGHLSMFGYDPLQYQVGRGALSAVGINFPIRPDDVAARINFCTIGDDGNLVDRRAGRIPTEVSTMLAAKLQEKARIDDCEVFIRPEMDYRGVAVFRGPGLSDRVTDSDPQVTGVPPLEMKALDRESQRTAVLANALAAQARTILADERPANGILLRGFARTPALPSLQEQFKLNPAAIAVYPMYRGLASLAGMKLLETGKTMADEVETLRQRWNEHDFFFVHFKYTDSAGEDGDFARKVRVIEEIDGLVGEIVKLGPDVFAMTGDHSTPAIMKAHSWHPVPFLLHSKWCLPDDAKRFTERNARKGSLGRFHASEAMGLMMAHAQKLLKFGA
ncbi:MAG: 2,3-bisphosphoglycerate-independent phosphoglycerate mutase [Chloroflexi bacterium]|nr:2,3-bisphosphoglycerate-independent phosphoglycerate mutase [Chloroflexota bacterium]